jgi:hypothetical protein
MVDGQPTGGVHLWNICKNSVFEMADAPLNMIDEESRQLGMMRINFEAIAGAYVNNHGKLLLTVATDASVSRRRETKPSLAYKSTAVTQAVFLYLIVVWQLLSLSQPMASWAAYCQPSRPTRCHFPQQAAQSSRQTDF